MKKILFVTNEFPAISETFVGNLTSQARDLGYDVSVLCSKKTSETDLPIYIYSSPPISRFQKIKDAMKFILKHPDKVMLFYSSIFRWGGIKSLGNFYSIINYLNMEREFDIYHVQFGLNGVPLATAKKANLIKGKIITTFHGYDAFPTAGIPFISYEFYKTLFDVGDLFYS